MVLSKVVKRAPGWWGMALNSILRIAYSTLKNQVGQWLWKLLLRLLSTPAIGKKKIICKHIDFT